MRRKINPNFKQLVKSYRANKSGVALEGSSRSGKTWNCIFFIVWLLKECKTPITINIIKETYNSFKTTLYDDFNAIFPMFGLYSPFLDVQDKPTFKILDHKINLIGADKPSKFLGAGCDFFYINEANHVIKKIFDQAEMRCKRFWFMDYNPEHEEHWIYNNVCTRDDVDFLRTTFLDNPFVPLKQKQKILSYEPTEQNIKNGTADEFMWKVYGLGLRASPKGVIFKYYNLYDNLDKDINYYKIYAVDWGGNDPTVLLELNINRKFRHLYVKEIVYAPEILNSKFIDILLKHNDKNHEIICDSARKDKIRELQMSKLNAFGATKGEGSIIDGIEKIKEFKIFIHKDSKNVINEFNTYSWTLDKRTDLILNVPEDKNNHAIDAIRYGIRYYIKNFGL